MMMLWEIISKSLLKLRQITLGVWLLNLVLLGFSLTKTGGGDIFLYNILHIFLYNIIPSMTRKWET